MSPRILDRLVSNMADVYMKHGIDEVNARVAQIFGKGISPAFTEFNEGFKQYMEVKLNGSQR